MIEHATPLLPTAGFAGALFIGASLASAAGIELPVPKVTIYPGDVIGQNLLADKTFAVPSDESWPVHLDRGGLIGKIAKRTLLPGNPIPLNSVREADLIAQGKPVTIIFQSGGLTITGRGVALQAGRAGDLLSLRNIDSNAIVKGIVQADGTVRVGGP
jgi:flagellar basal body P-ring formation protein FlgA